MCTATSESIACI